MLADASRSGFNQHDVRLYQPHYIHRLCQDNDTKALTRTLASDKTGVNLRDQNDMTPLQLTVVTADPPYLDSMMVRLIRNGADLDARVPSTGNTALHLAILYSKESNAELSVPILLLEGATPAIRNHLGKTPFDYALANDYRRLAELLAAVEEDPSLARQIDPYAWTPDGNGGAAAASPEELMAAIRSGNRAQAGQLMRQLAQLAYRETCCPLHWAVQYSQDKNGMLQELLSNDADPQQVDQENETPITLAIKTMKHDAEMLRVIYLLLLASVPKGHRNSDGQDALSLARQLGYQDVEELLLTGRNPDAKRVKQVTIIEPQSPPPPPTSRPKAVEPAKEAKAAPPKSDAPKAAPPKSDAPEAAPPKRLGNDPNKFNGEYHQLHLLAMQTNKPSIQMGQEIDDLFKANPGLDPDIMTNDEVGDTALHILVRSQKSRAVQSLLGLNATVDVRNKKKETPLGLSRNGPWGWDRDIEAMLLQANKRQRDALRQKRAAAAAEPAKTAPAAPAAAAASAAPAAPAPRKANDPINKFTEQYHQLHKLTMQKKKSGAQIAKEIDAYFRAHPGLDPDLKTNDEIGDTSLHMAVRDQKTDIIQSLLNHDATVNIKNKKNETPLTLSKEGQWGFDRDVDEMLVQANRRQLAAQREQNGQQ